MSKTIIKTERKVVEEIKGKVAWVRGKAAYVKDKANNTIVINLDDPSIYSIKVEGTVKSLKDLIGKTICIKMLINSYFKGYLLKQDKEVFFVEDDKDANNTQLFVANVAVLTTEQENVEEVEKMDEDVEENVEEPELITKKELFNC